MIKLVSHFQAHIANPLPLKLLLGTYEKTSSIDLAQLLTNQIQTQHEMQKSPLSPRKPRLTRKSVKKNTVEFRSFRTNNNHLCEGNNHISHLRTCRKSPYPSHRPSKGQYAIVPRRVIFRAKIKRTTIFPALRFWCQKKGMLQVALSASTFGRNLISL